MKKIKRTFEKILLLISNLKVFRFVLSIPFDGYLKQISWFESFESEMSIGAKKQPIPWVTYPFISFLDEKRLANTRFIFEYGSGNSTLYYANYVDGVDSVDHDSGWYEEIHSKVPSNVNLMFQELVYNGEYSKKILSTGKKYDLIIVDGRDRVNCIYQSVGALSDNGCIVLDDSEREQYKVAVEYLTEEKGFKKIDFWGISPGLFYLKNTTLFYKNNNVLNI